MKDEKFLCLKYLGRTSSVNLVTLLMLKESAVDVQLKTGSILWSFVIVKIPKAFRVVY